MSGFHLNEDGAQRWQDRKLLSKLGNWEINFKSNISILESKFNLESGYDSGK